MIERTAYCLCGARAEIEVDESDAYLAEGLIDIFWAAHVTAGHGPAGQTVARLARQRAAREYAESWGL